MREGILAVTSEERATTVGILRRRTQVIKGGQSSGYTQNPWAPTNNRIRWIQWSHTQDQQHTAIGDLGVLEGIILMDTLEDGSSAEINGRRNERPQDRELLRVVLPAI